MIFQRPETNISEWLQNLGINAHDTFRIVIDRRARKIRVWQYERNFEGKFFQRDGEIAKLEPVEIAVEVIPDFVTLDRYGAAEDTDDNRE